VLRIDHARPGHARRRPVRLSIEASMLSKIRFPALLILITAVLVAIGYWNIRPESFMQSPPAAVSAEPSIDFYVLNSRTVQYQPDGKRHYELTAEKLEHIKATDISELTRPDLYA